MTTGRGGRIDVAVAQPQRLIAEGLACAVDVEGIVAHVAQQDPDRLLEDLAASPPSVLVLDLEMVTASPARLLASIRVAAPETRIMLLADELDRASIRAARDEEIDGLVLKSATAEEFTSAVRQVAAGQAVFPEGFLRAVRRVESGDPLKGLSARQRQVLELVAEGLPNERIAERLFISTNTVRFHVREIYHRLGVHNRVQASRVLADMPDDNPAEGDMPRP